MTRRPRDAAVRLASATGSRLGKVRGSAGAAVLARGAVIAGAAVLAGRPPGVVAGAAVLAGRPPGVVAGAAVLAGRPPGMVAGAVRHSPIAASPRAPATSPISGAALATHVDVRGLELTTVEVRSGGGAWKSVSWTDLDRDVVAPGRSELRFRVEPGAEAVEIPPCAGREGIRIDGHDIAAAKGPVVATLSAGSHEVLVTLQVSRYERRVACGEPPRIGHPVATLEGLGMLTFSSPHSSRGGGQAVVYVPRGHDARRPSALLVGTHPWNGSMWTYASYDELLREARRRDVVLLFPQGLGNSLYTADAEDEVLRAIDALSTTVAVEPRAVSIWGASMGGAGATTIAFHHPDRFAFVASFFGDSRYDRSTYVGLILRSEAAAHAVNALDVVDNARNLRVWLIHGEDDRTSKIEQSELLADAMRARGYDVRFDRVAGAGHDGALVARFLAEVVDVAADARVPNRVTRVTYDSVRPCDLGAYGVSLDRSSAVGDAFIDVERCGDVVRVHRAEGVRSIRIVPGTFGTDPACPPPIAVDGRASSVDVAWDSR